MSSTSWHTDYLSALHIRDQAEHQNKAIYEAYAALASRKSQSVTQANTQATPKEEAASSPSPAPAPPSSPSNRVISWSRPGGRNASPSHNPSSGLAGPAPALVARWQEELSEAQRRRAELEGELSTAKAELERERTRLGVVERRATDLTSENERLVVRLRDRVEELKAKAKLVQDVHDESVALNLQLNISEEQNARLKKDNQELVDRWMARMGKEADAMNDASKF